MPARPAPPDPVHTTDRRENLLPAWLPGLATALVVLLAFALYAAGAAPGLTWAHQGADGGELVTAAVVNGVPHPPGYPLYILLLQAWLWLARGLGGELHWQAALFSALCAALSVGVTLRTALWGFRHVPNVTYGERPRHAASVTYGGLLWATLAALAWAISPLIWSQAVIAEVYALHALLLALLGWAVLVHPARLWYVTVIVALGVANHLTTLLLLPAAAYALWAGNRRPSGKPSAGGWRIAAALGAGLLLGALLYLRIPPAAGAVGGAQGGPPPVNWGYADNWAGFWWLVSGAAYRGYLFSDWPGALPAQLVGWAATITAQYTPVGLAVALVGLAYWDRVAPWLRNFSLLWLLPVSAYAVAYYTRDSDIYLLPVGWLMALWLAAGLAQIGGWLARRLGDRWLWGMAAVVLAGLIGLGVWRWPQMSLAADHEARDYLAQAASVLEPNSIVVTLEDRETFAFWYGVWGGKELAERALGVVPINDSLYQFDWYRRLQADLHPEIGGIGESVDAVIAANRGERPIFFAQLPANIAESELTPAGPLWRLNE